MSEYTDSYIIRKLDMDNAGTVSTLIKRELKKRNVPKDIIRKIAIATYEAEINVVIHSEGGVCNFFIDDDRIKIEFRDDGPGIENLDMALSKGFSTASYFARQQGFGAGMGLPNIASVCDYFRISSTKEGTIINLVFCLSEQCSICKSSTCLIRGVKDENQRVTPER